MSSSESPRQYLLSLEQIGIKLGLDQIRALVARLDHPDRAYPCIVVAGTNGKGSVTAMVERGLRAAGYRTGRYTSPHLVRLEERFAIDGEPISSQTFDAAADGIRRVASALAAPPSFFEATTALALDVFRQAQVDVAVLEVGLGGRLDATNVVHPVGVAITSIDFDHEQYLGHTLTAIAAEKAGVIKSGSVVVLAQNPPAVRTLVEETCVNTGAAFVFAPDHVDAHAVYLNGRAHLTLRTPRGRYDDVTLALRGAHQVENAVTAVRLLETLTETGRFAVPESAITTALTAVEWAGRLELVTWRGKDLLLDGAHNPAGARALARYVLDTFGHPLPVVMGAMRDKQIGAMIAALAPATSHFIFTAPHTPRAASPADLMLIARDVAPAVASSHASRPDGAVALAATHGAPIVVAGSLYLVGEIREEIS